MWLRKMSLGFRSMVCFGIFAFLIVCLCCFARIQTNSLNQATDQIGSQIVPSIKTLAALDKRFVELRSEHIRLRNPIETDTRKKQALNEIRSARESITDQLENLHGLMASDVANTALSKVQDSVVTMFRVEENYLDKLTKFGGEDRGVMDAREALTAASGKLSADFAALIDVNENIVAHTRKRANEIAAPSYRKAYFGVPAQSHVSALASKLVAEDPTGATGTADFQVQAVTIVGHSRQTSMDF